MSEWLGVDATEMAVMAELLLRGEQTLGDLRGRASRMKKIAGLSDLKPVLASLIGKNLVVELTPPGRGQIVTHNLYLEDELVRIRGQFERASTNAPQQSSQRISPAAANAETAANQNTPVSTARSDSDFADRIDCLEQEISGLKETVELLETRLDDLTG